MKILFKSSVRKDFALAIFKTIVGVKGGVERLLSLVGEGSQKGKKSLSKYNLANILYFSEKPLSVEKLMSGDSLRFFVEPVYNDEKLFIYLSTQWRYNNSKTMDLVSLADFVNREFFDFFKVEIQKNTFILKQIVEFLPKNPNKNSHLPRNLIIFGCPGTGKSFKMNEYASMLNAKIFRTTFHPDSDYSTFVGTYKPTSKNGTIGYQFVPQAFTKAYLQAVNNPQERVLLAIEEINRGNCAQIFGDIFQCLDRKGVGSSVYAIDVDSDLADFLKENINAAQRQKLTEALDNQYNGGKYFEKIALPSNLYIYATMNTADQSLFPMDSAFKRRWDWEFVPIDYEKASEFNIRIDEQTTYNWSDFISKINQNIKETTLSEDKQLGTYFIVPNGNEITYEQFRAKVMFYLWSEVYKDGGFYTQDAKNESKIFTFNDLFLANGIGLVKGFMRFLDVKI